MRVLIINAIYGSRSSGRSIAEIRNELQMSGHTVYVATPSVTNEPGFYRIGNKFDHKFHAFASRIIGLQGYFSYLATLQFIKYIDKINPDIIHIQVIHGNYINFKMLMEYISRKQIPVVFVLDDCWFFTGKCCHYIAAQCFKWKSQCTECPRKKDDNPSWFFDFSKKMYTDKKRLFSYLDRYAIVAVSEWLKNEAKQSFLKNASILTRIYNAIDMDKFYYRKDCIELKRKLGLEDKKIVLGVATAWDDSNGLSKGLNLFVQLAELLPDEFEIILVGKMKNIAMLPSKIRSIDFVEGTDLLAQYYSISDVFVQMSSEETFGKVTAEALACGTPCIVFDSTANPELIGEKCGFVVENKNIKQVYERILDIINNGKEYYSSSCRQFALSNFESRENARQYIELYKKLIDEV